MMHIGEFCLGCTRRIALARTFLISAKVAVLTSSQARIPFYGSQECVEGLDSGRTTKDESMIKVYQPLEISVLDE